MGEHGRFEIMCAAKPFEYKPTGFEVAILRNNMTAKVVDAGSFCDLIHKGHAWMPGVMKGGLTSSCWQRQQLIGLDFDNTVIVVDSAGRPVRDENGKIVKRYLSEGDAGYLSCRDALKRLHSNDIQPMCSYESYSSTEVNRRFRVVIRLDKPCKDAALLTNAVNRLLYLFPEADSSCSDLARMFYGTNDSKSCICFENTIEGYKPASMDSILALPERPPTVIKQRSYRPRKHHAFTDAELLSIERDTDLLSMIQADTGEVGRRSGRAICFHNCPVCGHHDCFAFYPDNNTWFCFSDSNLTGQRGGNVINYVMARTGASFREAINTLAPECGKGGSVFHGR